MVVISLMTTSQYSIKYVCNTCGSLFFSAQEVAYHKSMTGHIAYTRQQESKTDASGLVENEAQ